MFEPATRRGVPPALPVTVWSRPVRVATALVVALAGLAIVVGQGPQATTVELVTATTWLANEADGEIARVSGPAGEVEHRLRVRARPGDDLQLAAVGHDLYVLNADRGVVQRIDQRSILPVAQQRVPVGRLSLVAGRPGSGLAVLDRANGRVHVLDPDDLGPVDELAVGAGALSAAFDRDGALWIADPTGGAVTRRGPDGTRTDRRVGPPGTPLEVLVDGAGGAFLVDRAVGWWAGLTGPGRTQGEDWPAGAVTMATGATPAPALLAGSRWITFAADGTVRVDVDLGTASPAGRPVVADGQGYVPVSGGLVVVDPDGRVRARPTFAIPHTPRSTTVVDGHAFVVADGGSRAWVVDPEGRATVVELADPAAPRRDRRGRPVEDLPDALDPSGADGSDAVAPAGTRRGTIVRVVVAPDPCADEDCRPEPVPCDYGGTAVGCVPCANGGSATTATACPVACTHGGLPPPPGPCIPCPGPSGGDAAGPADCPPPMVPCTHGGMALDCVPCLDGSTAVDPPACPPIECLLGSSAPACVPCASGGTTAGPADCPTECVHGGTTLAGPCVPCPDGSDAVAGDWCPPACTHGGVPPVDGDCVPCPDGSTAVDPAWCPVPDDSARPARGA